MRLLTTIYRILLIELIVQLSIAIPLLVAVFINNFFELSFWLIMKLRLRRTLQQ